MQMVAVANVRPSLTIFVELEPRYNSARRSDKKYQQFLQKQL